MKIPEVDVSVDACEASGDNRAGSASERLNSSCFCISLDDVALRHALTTQLGSDELVNLIDERCPYLFSARPVFVSDSQMQQMTAVVRAVESVAAMPAYREYILEQAPPIARHDPRVSGVFFGYDFHIQGDRIGLIEINTNAGGAMLNAVMARAHQACCLSRDDIIAAMVSAEAFEDAIVAMFEEEWRRAGIPRALKTIAIVDAEPAAQYLYPEFVLFQRLFARHGLHAVVADPSEFTLRENNLWHGDRQVDLVYNRLTDFMLASPATSVLRAAYLADAVVLTPNPQAHALYADKRNLALLTDETRLKKLGVPQEIRSLLSTNILQTEAVHPTQAERLWRERRHLFFKPASGYGGRAAYRGNKVTKRVWEEILKGEYVAQALMAPGERVNGVPDNPASHKFDLRSYAYDGRVQWTAARVYQGQTTNFRTPGGGFAPVYSLPDADVTCAMEARR